MAENKSNKNKFNFMDLLVVVVTLAFVSAAVYYIVRGISGERKRYTVAYTVRLELNGADADKIKEGQNVLSSDGSTVIGTVKEVKAVKKSEVVVDRRLTTASALPDDTTMTETVLTTSSAAVSESEQTGTSVSETLTTSTAVLRETQIIIMTGKDYGVRPGELVSYRESEDTFVVYVTVIADVKAANDAYLVNGERVKVGKRAEFLTPYFYAVGEYYDIE